MPVNNDLTLKVGGYEVAGWKEIRVTRSMEIFPSDFELIAAEGIPNTVVSSLVEGAPCEISVAGKTLLVGKIDAVDEKLTINDHGVAVRGRSKCRELFDCSAEIASWHGTRNSTTITELAVELCQPYGIRVDDLTSRYPGGQTSNPRFEQFTANLGETPYSILERVARSVGVLVYDDPEGNLVLARFLGEPHSLRGSLVLGKNIEAITVRRSVDQRYHHYRVIPQSVNSFEDRRHEANQAGGARTNFIQAASIDPGVDPMRGLYIIGEQALLSRNLAQQRADWDRNRRWGRSQPISTTVDSWFDSQGRLWQPNTLVEVKAPKLIATNREWTLATVTFNKGAGGTTADLVLMPPQAFDIQPSVLQPTYADRTQAAREAADAARQDPRGGGQ
ncbi:hypothetical protein JYK14_01325 [Siccirubricoccus sp. KC 17139]|uniref:Phage tail protein n=1 Tax=Siccirubricoccus soli TaxID=2899147 RepID=A0ABT1CYS5_9PROT|nr:hypothetical protein [Siccirubricoccus soli]MCO6414821.1 hypothetical protein [Siccirubricoccus soli]MCP2680951.1 hypothetical protein [Siccirubricoccus soli]